MTLSVRLAIAWIGLLLLWLLFVFQLTWAELTAGAIASAAAVGAGFQTFRAIPACFKPRLRWFTRVFRLPGLIAKDSWLLVKHLLRQVRGEASQSSFEAATFPATGDSCSAAAQRALSTLFISTTPNSVVLEIDRQDSKMLFHRLEPGDFPEFLLRLED